LPASAEFTDSGPAFFLPDVFLEFIAEVLEGAHHGLSGGLPEGAEGGVYQDAGQPLHQVQVRHGSAALGDAGHGLQDAGGAFPAGGALAAGLVAEEFSHGADKIHYADTLVHHQHGPGAHGAARLGHGAVVHRGVQGRGGDEACRGAACLAHLELAAGEQTAAVGIDEFPQGQARRRFHYLRGPHLADDLVNLGAGGVGGAQGFIPGPALAENGRHAGQSLHVIDDGGLMPQAGNPGERRFGAGIAALAFDRFDQGGLLTADVAAASGTDFNGEGEVGAEELPAQEAPGGGLLNGLV